MNTNCYHQQELECTANDIKIKDKYKHIYYKIENIDKYKQYYLENKDNIENQDKINGKNNCECGGKYTNANKSSHFKTNKHMMYIFINDNQLV